MVLFLSLSCEGDCKADGTEIEYGYPITCGDSRAVLLFKKFVCPGINVRCVKVGQYAQSVHDVLIYYRRESVTASLYIFLFFAYVFCFFF